MWFDARRVPADGDRALRRAVRLRRLPATRSSCSSTRGRATAARSSSTRRPPAATWTTCATRSCAFVDARYPTAADRDHRGLTGKSSGGYGAMVVPMLRPDVFGALASHAGDALFEAAYLPEFPGFVRTLRDRFEGSFDVFFERLAAADHFDMDALPRDRALRLRGRLLARPARSPARRCCRSTSRPGGSIDDVWAQWLEKDPVRMAPGARRRAALDAARSTSTPARATSTTSTSARGRSPRSCDKLGVEHTLELFDGTHGGIAWRYPGAIRELVLALAVTATLDITGLTCPMTWVKTKLELERLAPGEVLTVRCARGRGARERAALGARGRPRGQRSRARRSGSCAGERRPPLVLPRAGRARWRARQRAARRGRGAGAARGRRAGALLAPARAARVERGARSWRCAARACSWSARARSARPVALYLAGAGVGRLGIVDADDVELSNLHRQLLHFTPDVGVPKAHSAAAKLGFLNPEVDRRALPGAPRRRQRRRAGRGRRPRRRLQRLVRHPLRRQRRLLRGADPARGGRRARHERAGDGDPAGGERVLPLRVPGAAAGRAELRRGGRARPGRGRDRLAAGARGAQAADRGGGAAARTPSCRSTSPTLAFLRVAVARRADCPDCGAA